MLAIVSCAYAETNGAKPRPFLEEAGQFVRESIKSSGIGTPAGNAKLGLSELGGLVNVSKSIEKQGVAVPGVLQNFQKDSVPACAYTWLKAAQNLNKVTSAGSKKGAWGAGWEGATIYAAGLAKDAGNWVGTEIGMLYTGPTGGFGPAITGYIVGEIFKMSAEVIMEKIGKTIGQVIAELMAIPDNIQNMMNAAMGQVDSTFENVQAKNQSALAGLNQNQQELAGMADARQRSLDQYRRQLIDMGVKIVTDAVDQNINKKNSVNIPEDVTTPDEPKEFKYNGKGKWCVLCNGIDARDGSYGKWIVYDRTDMTQADAEALAAMKNAENAKMRQQGVNIVIGDFRAAPSP